MREIDSLLRVYNVSIFINCARIWNDYSYRSTLYRLVFNVENNDFGARMGETWKCLSFLLKKEKARNQKKFVYLVAILPRENS